MTRVIFAGTPAFARESLAALSETDLRPLAVLTQPDRPAGRGKKLAMSPVKEYALAAGLPVLQPGSLRDAGVLAELRELAADVFVVAAYGLLLPQAVLDLPTVACVNVHASLLPRWRGAAPVQASILAGDVETGISLMQMDAGLDTGPVYARSAIRISATESAGELTARLARLGGEQLLQHLPAIAAGDLQAVAQPEDLASYAAKITTADAELDFRRPASDLVRGIRAYNPVPGAYAEINGERLKFWQAEVVAGVNTRPGTIVAAAAAGIDFACSEGCLRVTELQRPGKPRANAAGFAAYVTQSGLLGRVSN